MANSRIHAHTHTHRYKHETNFTLKSERTETKGVCFCWAKFRNRGVPLTLKIPRDAAIRILIKNEIKITRRDSSEARRLKSGCEALGGGEAGGKLRKTGKIGGGKKEVRAPSSGTPDSELDYHPNLDIHFFLLRNRSLSFYLYLYKEIECIF